MPIGKRRKHNAPIERQPAAVEGGRSSCGKPLPRKCSEDTRQQLKSYTAPSGCAACSQPARACAVIRPYSFLAISRSLNFSILPVEVFGISANTT